MIAGTISGLGVPVRASAGSVDRWHAARLAFAILIPFALPILASATWAYEPADALVFCVMLVANLVIADALATQVPPAMVLGALARVVVPSIGVSLAAYLAILATVRLIYAFLVGGRVYGPARPDLSSRHGS